MRPFYRIYALLLIAAFLLTSAGLIAAQQPATTPEQQPFQASPTAEILSTTQATATVIQATPTLATTATTAPARPTQAATTAALTQDVTYTVVRGDRLIKIAERYGVPFTCIARANRIINPNLIFIGQELLIPASCQGQGGGDTGTTTTTGGVTTVTGAGITGNGQCQFDRYPGRVAPGGVYTIRAGDTLDYIACDFGISLTCLQETNPQIAENRGRIRAGDDLTISLSCPAWDGGVIP